MSWIFLLNQKHTAQPVHQQKQNQIRSNQNRIKSNHSDSTQSENELNQIKTESV